MLQWVAEHVSRERVNRDEANRKKANFQPDPAVPVQFSAHNKGKDTAGSLIKEEAILSPRISCPSNLIPVPLICEPTMKYAKHKQNAS